MSFRHTLFAASCALVAALPFVATRAADAVPDYVTKAVNDGGRTPWDLPRDSLRKPAEVLAFAQIKPGMVVADLVPGDAYFTRMLAKLVGANGHVYAVVPNGGGGASRSSRMNQRLGKAPGHVPGDMGDQCTLGCYPTGGAPYVLNVDYLLALENTDDFKKTLTTLWEDLPQYGGDLALPQQADVIFTTNYHELHFTKFPPLPAYLKGRNAQIKALDVVAFTKSAFGALKPGGLYVIADYAAAKGAGFKQADDLHRTEIDAVKAEITAAGFVLDGESKALARSDDNHTTPARGDSATRDKADTFLLRFRKPANAPNTDKRPSKAQEDAIMKNYYGNTVVLNPQSKAANDKGERTRTSFYNADHTYQEFGRMSDGPGPMQMGTWWWGADGHNCELHQFPIDERSNVVCHTDVFAREIGAIGGQRTDGSGQKQMIVKGHVFKAYILP